MPKPPSPLPPGVRITDKLTFGYFSELFPVELIQQALAQTNRQTVRSRDLPNHIVVYFVMMLGLFREVAHTEVLRAVFEGFHWLFGSKFEPKITTKGGISQARSRVGWEPLRRVFDSVAEPMSIKGDKGCFYKNWRVVALDGSLFDVADTPENASHFIRPENGAGRHKAAYPQIRTVSLVECGTHAIFRTILGDKESELVLGKQLIPYLKPDMLCLADRLFLCYDLFTAADSTGAKLLMRARKDFKLTPKKRLPDHSYLADLNKFEGGKIVESREVRVVEYKVVGSENKESIRLVTNVFDPKQAPADELAALYRQRWEYENMMDEIKTHLNANAIVLRSRTPDLVKQELYGLFMAHYAVRRLMHAAARKNKIDDDELSFVHAVRVVRRTLPSASHFSPEGTLFAPC